MTVSRRNFARIAAASAAVVSSPAIAQQATVKWRLASSFPKNLRGPVGASPTVAKFVSEMSDGKFEIQPFAPAKSCPACRCSTRCRTARSNAAIAIRVTTSARIRR